MNNSIIKPGDRPDKPLSDRQIVASVLNHLYSIRDKWTYDYNEAARQLHEENIRLGVHQQYQNDHRNDYDLDYSTPVSQCQNKINNLFDRQKHALNEAKAWQQIIETFAAKFGTEIYINEKGEDCWKSAVPANTEAPKPL